MSFCFLYSVVESIQVGFKANERNVVNQWLSAGVKNKEMTLTGAWSCISM